MLGTADLVAFVATSDADRARGFYAGTLGLAVVEESRYAVVLDAGGTRLRVTVVERVAPAPYTVLGWSVPDLAAAIRALTARGVEFRRYAGLDQDALGVWRAPDGARVAWFADPDGNTLSLTQAPRPGGPG